MHTATRKVPCQPLNTLMPCRKAAAKEMLLYEFGFPGRASRSIFTRAEVRKALAHRSLPQANITPHEITQPGT